MSGLASLPREILGEIFLYADLQCRKELRLTCGTLATIGKGWVFRDTVVSLEDESYNRLENILADPSLVQCVTTVCLNVSKWNEEDVDYDEQSEHGDEAAEWSALPERFRALFHRLGELPRLQGVSLCFDEACADSDDWHIQVPQSQAFRSVVLRKLMTLLVSLPQLPQGLTLHNLHNINESEESAVADITQVLGALRSLRLNIVHQEDGNDDFDFDSTNPHEFFTALPSFWLNPAASNLEHLTIYSNLFYGFFPKLNLQGVHFPRLKSLAFGNYEFVHDSQLDWILSHGSTLTQLYLDNCHILFEVAIDCPEKTYLEPRVFERREGLPSQDRWASYGTRWHHYFRAFNEGLPLLRKFGFGCTSWLDLDHAHGNATTLTLGMGEECYAVFNDAYGPPYPLDSHMKYMTSIEGSEDQEYRDEAPLIPSEEDRQALGDLYRRIGQPFSPDMTYDLEEMVIGSHWS
ncbi:hypothetical protein FE257_008273 [Aspergillus nanangensis]|uniref:F-box domain-containing protein n=1 Tax=Aspergillus nanangensis TaxID=2582783 RepID=A0AAD4CNC9_ASPNN|nr:hypothetical protein FE257_008273 [Aspergillus nanangensis]